MAVSHKSVPGAGFSSAQEDDDGGKGDGGEGAQRWGSSVQESDPRSLVLSVWCLMTPEVLLSTPLHYNGDILLLLLFFLGMCGFIVVNIHNIKFTILIIPTIYLQNFCIFPN